MAGYSQAGIDLDAKFMARVNAKRADVGYQIAGSDISNRYEAIGGGTPIAPTGYKVTDTDLNLLFRNISESLGVTRTYDTPVTNATETVPSGVSTCLIEIWGAGGGGARGTTTRWGGGGGAYCARSFAVSAGQQTTYTVGSGGNGRKTTSGVGTAGVASSCNGGPVTVFMQANGGNGGTLSVGGAGGVASNGTTNSTGTTGTQSYGGGSPNGGANSTGGGVGNPPGGGGAGDVNADGWNGSAGRVRFTYT